PDDVAMWRASPTGPVFESGRVCRTYRKVQYSATHQGGAPQSGRAAFSARLKANTKTGPTKNHVARPLVTPIPHAGISCSTYFAAPRRFEITQVLQSGPVSP